VCAPEPLQRIHATIVQDCIQIGGEEVVGLQCTQILVRCQWECQDRAGLQKAQLSVLIKRAWTGPPSTKYNVWCETLHTASKAQLARFLFTVPTTTTKHTLKPTSCVVAEAELKQHHWPLPVM
jgi:hypothetical protein